MFGSSTVYNPWSLINYVKNLHANPKQSPIPYWVNTSSNDIIRKLIDISDESEKMEIEHLISGGAITKPIHEDVYCVTKTNSINRVLKSIYRSFSDPIFRIC